MNALLIEIEDTAKEYLSACNAASAARSNETALLNVLNEMQKKFDEALSALKAQSPRESNWKRSVTKRESDNA